MSSVSPSNRTKKRLEFHCQRQGEDLFMSHVWCVFGVPYSHSSKFRHGFVKQTGGMKMSAEIIQNTVQKI